jgi:hypothetical protein
MPYRSLKMEENTKYIPTIFKIVETRLKEFYVNFTFILIANIFIIFIAR